jgi:hypothetical protein
MHLYNINIIYMKCIIMQICFSYVGIITCRGLRVTKSRVLVRMIGFISTYVTDYLITLKYTANTALSLIYTHSSSPLRTY